MAPNHQLSFGPWDMDDDDDDDINFESLFGSFSATNDATTAPAPAPAPVSMKYLKPLKDQEKRWGDESVTTTVSEDGKSEIEVEEEEDVFLALDRKRATKARFPPGCTVVVSQFLSPGADYEKVTKVFHQGTVKKVGIHADNRETIYRVQMTNHPSSEMMTVREMDVQFAVGTPVWFKSSDDTTEEAVVVGSQETVACHDHGRFALSLFGSSNAPPRGLRYSVHVLSLTDMMINHTISNVFHGVPPDDVTFRSSSDHLLLPKSESNTSTSPTRDQDIVEGLLDLVEPSLSLANSIPSPYPSPSHNQGDEATKLSCQWASDGQNTNSSSNQKRNDQGTTSTTKTSVGSVSTDSPSSFAQAALSRIKRGGDDTNTLRWADMVGARTNAPPILARVSTDSTASSSDSTDGTTTWSQRVKRAATLKKLNEDPPIKLQILPNKKTKRTPTQKKTKRDNLVTKKPNMKTTAAKSIHVGKASLTDDVNDNTPQLKAAGNVSIVKSIELPSLSFGNQFLMDSISGKNGSRLKALCSEHNCTLDFFEAKPEGCIHHASLFVNVKGPSLLEISRCALAIEEELFYSVPPRLRGFLLSKLGLHNDYREERSGIVFSHNPFSATNNIVEDHCAVSAGSHLRHIAILKTGPCSKPLQKVFGFKEAKQWKQDLKHRFPSCEIDIVDAADYYGKGFPGLCSHIVIAGLQFEEVYNCREEFLSRLKRRFQKW